MFFPIKLYIYKIKNEYGQKIKKRQGHSMKKIKEQFGY